LLEAEPRRAGQGRECSRRREDRRRPPRTPGLGRAHKPSVGFPPMSSRQEEKERRRRERLEAEQAAAAASARKRRTGFLVGGGLAGAAIAAIVIAVAASGGGGKTSHKASASQAKLNAALQTKAAAAGCAARP